MSTAERMRAHYENHYGDKVLSTDVIDTIVNTYVRRGEGNPADIIEQARILRKTLTWSSSYNSQNGE